MASAICGLWKIFGCLFIPNCTRKIIWLLVNNIQVTISVTLRYFTCKRRPPATSTLLDKNLTCEFKRKNSFTLSKSCMKTVKSSLYPQLNIEELDHKAKKKLTSLRIRCGLDAAFFSNVFRVVEKLWAVSVYAEKKPFNTAQVAYTKIPRKLKKLKSSRKRSFWALKDIY